MCTLDSDLIMREIWERLNQWIILFLLFILFWFNLVCCDLKSGPGFACLKAEAPASEACDKWSPSLFLLFPALRMLVL